MHLAQVLAKAAELPDDQRPRYIINYIRSKQKLVDWILNRPMEAGVRMLSDNSPEYHRSTMSPHRGMRGEVVGTEEFGTAEGCISQTMRTIGG